MEKVTGKSEIRMDGWIGVFCGILTISLQTPAMQGGRL
jgi:hypothetical protein